MAEAHLLRNKQKGINISKLLKLSPFIDKYCDVQINGRLSESREMTFEEQHPALIAKTDGLFKAKICIHCIYSTESDLSRTKTMIHKHFWLGKGSGQIHKLVDGCPYCFRYMRVTPTSQSHNYNSQAIHECGNELCRTLYIKEFIVYRIFELIIFFIKTTNETN